MSKWREERMYEIMHHLWDNPKLMELYELEMKKAHAEKYVEEFFPKMEKCYEKALKEYENLQG
jgi:hypothetical protein